MARPQFLGATVLLFVIGITGSVAIGSTLDSFQDEVTATRFRRDAEERAIAVEGNFDIALETLDSLARYFRVSEHVRRDQFRDFTAPVLATYATSIQAFGWNPRVTLEERLEYERRNQEAGHPGYEITELGSHGEMVRAADRDEYVAVSYLEPLEGNENALGYDIYSEDARRAALDAAWESGGLRITAPVRLVQDQQEDLHGFLACIPIRKQDGFVVGVYHAGDILQRALDDLEPLPLAIRLRDAGSPVGEYLVSRRFGDVDGDLAHLTTLTYGGREWLLEIRPTAAYLAGHRSPVPAVALIVGLFITTLLSSYLTVLRTRSERIASLVETVQQSEERHRLTLEAIADGAWDWNVDTGECHYSAGWLASLGYDPDQVPDHVDFWRDIVHPDDLPGARAALKPHFAGEVPRCESRYRVRRKDGDWRWNLSRGRVVAWGTDARPLRMVGTNTDITDRVRAEAEQAAVEQRLQHSQKLESLGVLAGGIAHDFNNLLVAMLGGADLALMSTELDPKTRDLLEQIKRAAIRATDLTDQMLAYAGRNAMVREPVSLAHIVEEMSELLVAAKSKKARLEIDVALGVPAVMGDPTQLGQVVMNLITNASDAIGDGAGTIVVRIGTAVVSKGELATMLLGPDRPSGEYVVLDVADTGSGMNAETVDRVFDPFFTTKFQGRGLGLAAVLGIVRSHGGAVRVLSTPGEGTNVRVILPAAEDELATTTGAEAPATSRVVTGTVLVIDDERAVRQLARSLLKTTALDVLEAADGPEGIAIFEQRADDIVLVILDMTMPVMSGTETILELHKIRPDTPVLFTSGYSETEASAAVEKYGAVGFIKKPYRMNTFLAAVEAAIGGGAIDGGESP